MFDRAQLQKVLQRIGAPQPASFYETQDLDFKQPGRSPKETLSLVADAAVCFANAQGGIVVLGVNDKATTRDQALVGVDPVLSVDTIRKGIFDRTQPQLTPFVYEHFEKDVRLVVIEVPAGVLPHSNAAGLATRRIGRECRPFTPDQQREVLAARGQIDWSSDSAAIPLTELSRLELERLRRLLREGGDGRLAELRDRQLLEALQLVSPEGDATNAALLLLGTEEQLRRKIPSYGYSYQYRPTPGSEATGRFRGERPILAAVEQLLELVESRIQLRPLSMAGGVQLTLYDYPAQAVREVVVNAFIHRSYELVGTVDVEHTPEWLTVVSPGGLVAGVTPDNILTHPSTPRHRLLTEAVAFSHLAEKTGQGIDRTYREMLRAGKTPPVFEDSGLFVRVALAGGIGNDALVRFLTDLPEELSRDVDVLLVLGLLRDRPSVDAKRVATVIQRSVAEAEDVLERLADESVAILEPTRGTVRRRLPTYRLRGESLAALARAVSYRRRTLDQTDAKIIEHVHEYGFVTNRTLQRMFDVQLFAARNLLADLQARGLLEKIGAARGGPGVRYGPGPNFPSDQLPVLDRR